MRAFAAMFVAAAGYILIVGSLLGMTTVAPSPAHVLTAELGESTVLAVETTPALVAGCEPARMR